MQKVYRSGWRSWDSCLSRWKDTDTEAAAKKTHRPLLSRSQYLRLEGERLAFALNPLLLSKTRPHQPLFTQSHPTRCDPMDCSPPSSSVQGIPRQEPWRGNFLLHVRREPCCFPHSPLSGAERLGKKNGQVSRPHPGGETLAKAQSWGPSHRGRQQHSGLTARHCRQTLRLGEDWWLLNFIAKIVCETLK